MRRRRRAGMTQRQLAAQLARTHSFIGKIECGIQELKGAELLDYARALRMDPAEVLRQVAPSASTPLNADELDSTQTSAIK
jgi:transcriptional regulator with XRE-family HTH domain